MLYSRAIHNLAKLEQELSSTETEEANAADQLATFLAVCGMPQVQDDYY